MKNVVLLDEPNWFFTWGYIVLIVLIVLIMGGLFFYLFLYKKGIEKKNNSIDNNLVNEFIKALGGKENINSIESRGSRVIAKLKNVDGIDEEYFKNKKEVSMIRSTDKITFVVGSLSKEIEETFNKQ